MLVLVSENTITNEHAILKRIVRYNELGVIKPGKNRFWFFPYEVKTILRGRP